MKKYFDTFMRYRHLLMNLVARDLKVKYRRSFLGYVWSVLNPLLMTLVITVVFQEMFKITQPNFPVYYLTGSLIFNFVTESTNGGLTSVLGGGALIKKVYIPKYIFPLQKVLFAFVNMLFSLFSLIVLMIVFQIPVTWTHLLFPIPLLYVFVFATGLSMLLATVNVFFRDVGHLWSVFTMAWMYLTPIIYPLSMVENIPVLLAVMKFNPLYYYVTYFREIIMSGTLPGLEFNLICAAFSIGMLIIGVWVFKRKQDRFILYI